MTARIRRKTQYLTMAALLAAIVSAGCREREAQATPVAQATPATPPGYVVDSALSPDELLRRFRAGLRPVPHLVADAPRSRDSLVSRFARALTRDDSAALRALRLNRSEFAYLYYPESEYTQQPHFMPPDVLWLLMQNRSQRGERRLLDRLGGSFRFVGLECEPNPRREGANVFYERCLVSYRRTGADSLERRRLFGSILERDGGFKFVSYANDF
jgi:hypothetical protein